MHFRIVILAGDSSISTVINAIIEFEINRYKNYDFENNSNQLELSDIIKTPFCFIPTGSTNIIANSFYGITNYITPLMYLFYGNKITYVN